jgi:Asp/Glu/hydantoin racemase
MTEFLIINPNSSEAVTRAMDECLEPLRGLTPHQLLCQTNPNGPLGIETDEHVAAVVPDVQAAIAESGADAYIVACFSDPGVDDLRQISAKPVIGIAEAAYHTALTLGQRFGVISIVEASIRRHRIRIGALGLTERLAGDRALNLGVSELQAAGTFERLVEVGTALRDLDGADVLILGCAGLGQYREALQRQSRLPVIDPVQAAVVQLCAMSMLGVLGPSPVIPTPSDHRVRLGA